MRLTGTLRQVVLGWILPGLIFGSWGAPAYGCVPGMMSLDAATASTLHTAEGLGVTFLSWHDVRRNLRSGTMDVENEEGQKANSWRNTLVLDYNVYQKWTAIVSIPYVYSRVSHAGEDEGTTVNETIKGIGDVAFLAKYAIYRDRLFNPLQEIGLIAGIEVPTGSQHKPEPGEEAILSATEQAGSRTTNYIIGANGYRRFSRLALYGDLTYEIYGHNADYRFGNTLGTRIGVSVPVPGVKPLAFDTEFIAHILARDHSGTPGDGVLENGKVDNSGSETLYIAPGLEWQIRPDLVFKPAIQIPVYQNMRGTQLRTSYNLTFSLSARFGAKSVTVPD